MNGFFSSVPPARDWFYGARTFAASMIALYIALLMQLPRPYWAMATVYIVSSPFVGPTSSKALYRAVGTLLGAGGAIFLVPPLVQSPLLLSIAIALWTGTLLFLSLNLRTANNYVLMLAGYTLPMIALAVVDNPLAVFDVASSRAQEICLGIVCAAVVGAIFWPRRLAPWWSAPLVTGSPRRSATATPTWPAKPAPTRSAACAGRWSPPSTRWS